LVDVGVGCVVLGGSGKRGAVWPGGRITRLCPNGQDDLRNSWQKVDDICHVKTTTAKPNNLFKSSLKETSHEHRTDWLGGDYF
jgi:hypothetical protein